MATKRVWNPAHHPRDARGRFTKSATRVLKASDAKRAKAAVAGFKPTDLGPGAGDGKAWLERQAAAKAAADDAVARYFAGGWKTTHAALRTQKDAATDPDVVAIDKAMQPLSDDVMLERRVSLKMFAHIPMEQLQGMKVRDAAYQPTALQGSQGEAPDGMVTIHMAVPAGTRAIINPETGAVVLDRDTETAISRVEPNGRGGYDLYGIVIPRQGQTKPGRPAGEPAQDDQGAPAPNADPQAPNDGATPAQGDQDTAGGSAAAGGDNTRRRRPATPPRNATGDDAGDQSDAGAAGAGGDTDDDQGAGDGTTTRPRKAAASTAGTRAPGRRRTAAQGGQDAGDDQQDEDAEATAAAAAQVADVAADHERITGRPAPTRVDELERNDHVRVAGEGRIGRTTVTGYASTPNQIGDQLWMTVTRFPDGNGPRTNIRVTPDTPVYVQPHPDPDDVALYKNAKSGRPAPNATYVEQIRGQVVRDREREATVKARIAELSGASTPEAAAGAQGVDAPAGSRLAELTPADRVMLANRVADEGPGIFQSPLTGRNFGDVARYVTEAGGSKPLVDKYGTDTVWRAAEEYARANPAVLARTPDEVKALQADRAQRASAQATAAAASTKAGDYAAARAAIDAGEMIDPVHRENFRSWDEMRAIVARVEEKNGGQQQPAQDAPAAPDASTAGTSAPDAGEPAQGDAETPAAGPVMGEAPAGFVPREQRPEYRRDYLRGRRASSGPNTAGKLEAADLRGEPTAWYHGWEDYANGDPEWTSAKTDDADEIDRANGDQPYAFRSYRLGPDGEELGSRVEVVAGLASLNHKIAGSRPGDKLADPVPAGTSGARGRVEDRGMVYEWGPYDGRNGIAPEGAPGGDTGSTPQARAAAGTAAPTGVSPLGEDLDAPPPAGPDRADPEVAQPARGKWDELGLQSGARVMWFGDATRPKGRGEPATIVVRGTGRNRTLLVTGDDGSDLLRRQNIGDRMWVAPVDAPEPAGAGDRDDSTAGTGAPTTPEASADTRPAARIGDRPAGDVDELLANPTVAEETAYAASGTQAERLTWDPSLSAPRVVQTADVDGREVAIVQYRTLTKPTRDATPTLGYDDRFYAVPAGAQFRPLSMVFSTGGRYYAAGSPMGSGTTVAEMRGEYRDPHIASGNTAAAALSGARAKIEKETLRARYAPVAAVNVGVHDRAAFDRLDPNAEIRPGDLVVLQSFGKLRTGVATKVTANKVDALVSTPTGAADNWYGTAQIGIGVRLLRRVDAPAAADPAPADDEPSTAGTGAPAVGELTTEPPHVLSHSINAAVGGAGVRSFVQADGTVRVTARSVAEGRIAYERGVARMRRNFPDVAVPVRFEVRVRRTADRDINPATGGYRDERTGDVVVPLTGDDFDPAGADSPAAPVLDENERRAAVAGRVFAQGQLDDVTDDDTRFRMRRARVGNRDMDLYDEQGTRLGALTEQPTGWVTMPANGRAGITAPTFPDAVRSLRAGENSPEATPVTREPAPDATPTPARREQIGDSLAGDRMVATAEAVDTAIDKAAPDDPHAARAAALEAKEAELAKANAALAAHNPTVYGNQRTVSAYRRAEASISKAAELARNVDRLEREVAALRRPPAPTVPKGGFTPERLADATHVRTRIGWHRVVKVNKKSVKVETAPGMDDLIPLKRITEIRGGNDSTAGTRTPDADAGAAGDPEATSITRQADPFALAAGTGGDDLDAAFGPADPTPAPAPSTAGTSAPAVDVDAVQADDQVRVAGQWATVTAKVDGQIRVRFPDDRLALVAPGDIRGHRPATRVEDMFGGTSVFVPQDRATIGVAARADVGRTAGQQQVQQVSMFDVADQQQIDGQTALLDALLNMPTAEPPASVPLAAADAPEPDRVDVPEDLSGWTDEQLAGLFAEVSAQADYDEPGTLRIMAEWDRREAEMRAALAQVPDDLTTLDHDTVADLFALVTSHHGTMDSDVVARLEADLDRRDREHVAALADLDAKRALVAKPLDEFADDDEIVAAVGAAADLGDEAAADRLLAELDRRERVAAEEAAARAEEERQAAIAEAEAETARVAAESAAAARRSLEQQMAVARSAGAVPRNTNGRTKQAMAVLGEERLRELVGEEAVLDAQNGGAFTLSTEDQARIVFAASGVEAEREFADMTDEQLTAVISKGLFGRGGAEDQARTQRAARERSRRELAQREAEDAQLLASYRQDILLGDVTRLSDADLAAAPALIGAMYGPDGEEAFRTRLPQLNAEVARRQNAAADKEARRAAGPAGPARLNNPVVALADVEMHAGRGFSNGGFRAQDAAARLREAKRAVFGLDESTTESEINAAQRKDPRGYPEQAALILAWYRHLGEIDLADDTDRAMISGWMRGPADDPDYREPVPALPPVTIQKAPEVWEKLKAQAVADRQAGDNSGAFRYTQAIARAYGIWYDPETANTEEGVKEISGRFNYVMSRDPRTANQQAAAFIAEWQRLADEQGVDPGDELRYGPRPKAKRAKARGTWRESTPAQEAQINALVAQGRDWLEAYAFVHNLDVADLRREEAAYEARTTAMGASSSAAAYRQHYDEMVHSAYLAAEEGTRGNLLNDAGKKAGIDPISLFSGPSARANKYASEELKRWWGEHPPPRMTFTQYKRMVQGNASGANEAALQAAKGNEFA